MTFEPWLMLVGGLIPAIILARSAWLWWKFRGQRVVRCPENQRPAGVAVDASRAALSVLRAHPSLQLNTCSRWPERAGCGQECLRQIKEAPADCLVRNILVNWYEGKCCRSCGRPIGPIVTGGAQPALLSADKKSVEWSDIPAEQLQEVLSAAEPVCFACHMASKMMREHPELVIDRSVAAVRPSR